MDRPSRLLYTLVVEFPENAYVLSVKKDSDTGYEHVILNPSWRVREANVFRWFRNMQTRSDIENGAETVRSMIEVFRQSKDQLFASLKEYILLEGIVQTSYRLQVNDSDLIHQQLDLMYECWSSFGPLHTKAILGRNARKPAKNAPHILRYFLEHARRKKLLYGGIRMIDVSVYSCVRRFPVFMAADSWCCKQMLIYLQYGARFEDLFQDPAKSFYKISCPLTETLRNLIRHLWYRIASLTERPIYSKEEICSSLEIMGADAKDLCDTLNILLRAVRRVKPESLDFNIRELTGINSVALIPSRDIMMHPVVQILIPKLSRRYECADELKHICRWTIRKRLNENWQLPAGIGTLPVPENIKRYLNLQID